MPETIETPPAPETFTKDELESRVEAARKAALSEYQRKNPTWKPEERDELEQLRATRKAEEQKKLEAKGEYDKLMEARLKSKDEEWSQKYDAKDKENVLYRERLEGRAIKSELVSAFARGGAINPEKAAKLYLERIKYDVETDKAIVLDERGVPSFHGGAETTIDQFVDSVKKDATNYWLFQPTNTAVGGGATGGRTQQTGDTSALTEIDAKITAAVARVNESRNTDTKAMNEVLRLSDERKKLVAGAE